ncbi:microtubule-binding protein [Vulcanisaeta sp. EB80]|uniref:PD-(D/E)XK nuclease family protein n=1 Tax=Vulcanisaeta sp. EB80 TaxID=1650660 RepID=UPI0009C1641B|nr:DUF3782 domain-containing protein [Vulcanisaeta sp. EB80]PLC68112.1 microtubule-binding protein [Vulcanisaeta sp. EB80]
MSSIDWDRLEEVVERAVRRARSEELKEMAEAVKALAEYMRTGFQEILKRLDEHDKRLSEITEILRRHEEILKRHEEILSGHGKTLNELVKAVGELKVAMGSLGRRWGVDLEKTILKIYKDALESRGIEPGKVEKFIYTDVDGKYYRQGARLEIDVYIHDDKVYLIEVKSHAELDDVEWLFDKAAIVGKILGRKIERVMLVAVNVDKEAFERANQLGIDVIYGSIIE